MPKNYTVAPGDTIFSIAHAHGFRSLELILNAPENAGLKADRGQIVAGATVVIPDKQPLTVEVRPGQELKITVKTLKASIALYLEDEEEHPYANKEYSLVANVVETPGEPPKARPPILGTTDAEGHMSQVVPPTTVSADLELWPDGKNNPNKVTWHLELGAQAAATPGS